MSYPAYPFRPLRHFNGFLPQISRITLAAALCGFAVALTPARAGEPDISANDSGLFNVPGEGPPYKSRLAPRVGWPPMPERRPHYFARDFRDDLPGYDHDVPRPPKRYVFDAEPYDGHDHDIRDDREPDHDVGPDDGPPPVYAFEHGDGFGRMFPQARPGDGGPYASASYRALKALGRSMVENYDPDDPAGNSEVPSGYVYFGQFIDHDLTLDTTSDLGHEIQGDDELHNARTPDLDLDNVYGGGPERAPYLYNLPYIRVGRPVSAEGYPPRYDLFRTNSSHYPGPAGGEPVALLGDARNGENIIISQIHAAFVALHNRTVDILVERDFGRERGAFCHRGRDCDTRELADALPDDAKLKIFQTAQDHVIHYYHRLIVDDFLPWVIGPQHTANLLRHGRDFFFPDGFRGPDGRLRDVFIPVEFAAAAFRYGHSQVRESYTLRTGVHIDLFSNGHDGGPSAFAPITPRYLIDWRYFFDIGPERPPGFNYARRIDAELVRSLQGLDRANIVGTGEVSSLAARDLMRGKTLHLPSGQEVARIVLPVLEARGLLGKGDPDFRGRYGHEFWRAYLLPPDDRARHFLGNAETPLWYYILQEADTFGTRSHLRALPYDDGARTSGDYPHRGYGRLFKEASAEYRYGPHGPDDGARYDGPDAGHRLGPVGATIVGEVLTGLIDYYREKTGKGLDYDPEIKGSASRFGVNGGDRSDHRYLMRNFLVDAGVVDGD